MGLMDVLNGMMNGPRGQRQPTTGTGTTGTGGGMSPWMMALLGLLAYKAFQGRSGQSAPPGAGGEPGAGYGGGFGDVFGRGLGGPQQGGPVEPGAGMPGNLRDLLGGAAAGTILSHGLGNLIKGFQDKGYGQAAQSWVGTGPNEDIPPESLEHALGKDTLDTLSRQTGLGREELVNGLREQLPEFVDQLTPDGRLPTEEEASRMV
jgi:uncharacterized protein YidB (DUF937 family)